MLADELQADALERFLRYVRIDTQSAHDSDSFPSTAKQLDLSRLLVDELRAAGLADAELTEHGYVFATLAGVEGAPTVGLLAHVDTAPDASGTNVEPQVHERYDGRDLVAGLSPETSPLLGERLGHDIVTTDGTTLLGADDKAGVAEIMAAVAYLAAHPEIEHAPARMCFTVDEEVGHGVDHLDLEQFGADFAYTLDGERVGEIENETWSALELKVTFPGVPVHPGLAKGKLVNPIKLAARFVDSLPPEMAPETTDGRDGFIHPSAISGDPVRATVVTHVRDYDWDGLLAKERLLRELAQSVSPDVVFERWEQYRNMREGLERAPQVVEAALEATRRVGLEPKLASIRGGTDGSRLTELGLPTPNVYTGGNEFHSVREWISVQDMALSSATVVELLKLWAEPAWRARARP
ncbi:MAG TPA: peptidase T [Gaiellaceae bacterium]|nr:peptidase T [Gaiellaceae bacterium]